MTVPIITLVPGTTAKAEDLNTSLGNLNVTTIPVNDAGTLERQQTFIGTTDPTTLAGVTVHDGDLWGDGRYVNSFAVLTPVWYERHGLSGPSTARRWGLLSEACSSTFDALDALDW